MFNSLLASYEPDLLARFFGVGLGAILGLLSAIIALIGFGIINYCFSRSKNEENAAEKTSAAPDENATKTSPSKFCWLKGCLLGYVLFPLLWITLTALIAAVYGFFQGLSFDAHYYDCHINKNPGSHIGLPLGALLAFIFFILLITLLLRKSERASYSKRHRNIRFRTGINLVILSIAATYIGTAVFCQPSIPYKDKELESGVYLYTNDTAYNVTGVNIYSSRCGGFAHSGFFLITKDPKAENAQRRKDGLKDLRFIKLQRGYYVNMISMAVPDVDGFTNYQSRCYPQENAYDFDTEALKNYLAGHSPNDLPAPAVRLIQVPVTDVHKAWNRIDEFKRTFNKRFPDGMIYSPVPYTDEHIKTINCNTYSAAVIDALDKENLIDKSNQKNICQFEKLINRFGNFGRQKLSDGQRLNEFLAQDDAPDQVKRQWEFVKTTPLNEQNFWANVLRPDGSYGKSLSKLVNKPKD